MFFSVTCPCCFDPKVQLHRMCNAVWNGFERFTLVSIQIHLDTNRSLFQYTSKVDSTQTEINLIQTDVTS